MSGHNCIKCGAYVSEGVPAIPAKEWRGAAIALAEACKARGVAGEWPEIAPLVRRILALAKAAPAASPTPEEAA